MVSFDIFPLIQFNKAATLRRVICGVLLLVISVGLPACKSKGKKSGQALVRVNGEEITVLQINDELRRAGVKSDQQEYATGKFLQILIDRNLLSDEAMRNRIDRTPEVVQAIERAKSEIIAQAYLSSVMTKISRPSVAEVHDYFQKHPEYFSERKQLDMHQLVISENDFNAELRLFIDSANSIDEVAAWLDSHNVKYARGQLSRSTSDMPEQMVATIKNMNKGQLFLIKERDNHLLNFIIDIKDSPVTFKNAALQIEQYLINKKSKDAVDAEIAHLRSLAKIEYLNASAPVAN